MHRSLLVAIALLAACEDDTSGESDVTSGSSGSSGTSSGVVSQTSKPEDSGSTSDGSTSDEGGSSTGDGSSGGSTSTGSSEAMTGSSSTSDTTGDPAFCGDGQVDPGETCDDGQATKLCDDDCTAAACGDAHVNPAAGEACDDGNVDETDGCRSTCKLPACGDATLDVTEACDDGNAINGDGCDADCTKSWWDNEGVAYDVQIAALKGWTLCWEGQAAQSLLDGVKACPGEHLLAACAPLDEQVTLTMAAHGPRKDVTTLSSINAPHVVNGAQWVYGATWFGFSPPGVDMNTEGPLLLWGMNQYDLLGLSNCKDFNTDGKYRRLLFRR